VVAALGSRSGSTSLQEVLSERLIEDLDTFRDDRPAWCR
jgi:hypothetical protein